MREYTYEIGGVTYVQRPLVLGQIRQLIAALRPVQIPADADALDLIAALGDHLPKVMAIVLTEQGGSPRNKDVAALAETLADVMTAEVAIQVIEDFFACNPVPSLLSRMANVFMGAFGPATVTETGSRTSPSSSAPEISRDGTPSSGASD